MRFQRQAFFNDAPMCAWVKATHLAGLDEVKFGSFMLVGVNTDPVEVHLYTPVQPAYNEQPVASYEFSGEAMVLRPPAVKRKRVEVVVEPVAPKVNSGPMRYVG